MVITRVPFSDISWLNINSLKKPPAFLDIASKDGNLDLLNKLPNVGLGIVGSRNPQRKSERLVDESLRKLRHTNLIIISGFARGIDATAHECAMKYGLRTIALIGSGLNVIYPKENVALKERIIESGGLVISAFESESPPLARNFYLRNGLIAAFSKAVWVVEAAEVSGTLNTAHHARELHRDLYATPAFPGDPDYQGNEKLLSDQSTEKYSLAFPFYDPESLGVTWPSLAPIQEEFSIYPQIKLSRLQKWVKNLKSECGECLIQNLMNYAMNQGLSPGEFYREYERECNLGLLVECADGKVDYHLNQKSY